MRKQGYELSVLGYGKKAISILVVFSLLITQYSLPITISAQTASSSAIPRTTQNSTSTKKNVVKNFKINLAEYSSFGTNCDKKPQGDANCDGLINDFDLSIWEVEFNSNNPPKRADFNNDGAVTIVDYGIWRTTTYPQATSLLPSVILNLIQDPEKTAWIPDQVRNDILNINRKGAELITQYSSLITVYAQESSSGGGEVNSSQSFTSPGGTSMVINNIGSGNTQQVNFDQSGNPQTAAFYRANGQSYAEVAFTNSGGTVISTQSDGIPVTINKTASGPIIENFRNPDGTPLAIKSWPTQASYDDGQPPIAVTIPGIGSTKEVLNLQPNGDGIVEKLDAAGNVLTRTQLRFNGTTVTEDFQNHTLVQSNSEIGFTNMSMKNLIGGDTQYMFYKGTLYAIIQSDNNKNSFISKPLDDQGNSWTFETWTEGIKRSEENIPDPITKTNGGTPNPKTLIQYINYYKQAPTNPNAITFSEGFTSTAPGIKNPVDKANAILTISQTQPPAVLGIIKETNAQSAAPPPPLTPTAPSGFTVTEQPTNIQPLAGNDGWTYQWDIKDSQGNYVGNIQTQLPSATNLGVTAPTGQQQFGQITINMVGKEEVINPIKDLADLEGLRDNKSLQIEISPGFFSTSVASPEQPAAAPADQPQAPAAPGYHETRAAAVDAAARAAGEAADALGEAATPTQRGVEARNEMSRSLNASDLFEPSEVAKYADTAFVTSYLSAQGNFELGNVQSMTTARDDGRMQQAINTLRSETGKEPSISVGDLYNLSTNSQTETNTTPPSALTAAAAAAPGLPERGATTSLGNGFTSTITGYIDTNIRATGLEGFSSNIYDANGNLVATQISTPEGRSDWTDVATGNTYTAQSGSLSAMTSDVSAPGSIIGVSASDHTSVVAVGDASYINAEGFLEGGRPVTDAEYSDWQDRQAIQEQTNPEATQYSTSRGDLSGGGEARGEADNWGDSSTWGGPPSGPEDAGPGDGGYSGNEIDQGGNFGGEQVGSQAGPDTTSDTSQSFSNDNFNNDTSNGSDANSAGADSSGW